MRLKTLNNQMLPIHFYFSFNFLLYEGLTCTLFASFLSERCGKNTFLKNVEHCTGNMSYNSML